MSHPRLFHLQNENIMEGSSQKQLELSLETIKTAGEVATAGKSLLQGVLNRHDGPSHAPQKGFSQKASGKFKQVLSFPLPFS